MGCLKMKAHDSSRGQNQGTWLEDTVKRAALTPLTGNLKPDMSGSERERTKLKFSKITDFHTATKCNSIDLSPNICEKSLDRESASQDSLWNWVILASSVILETLLNYGRLCDSCSGVTGWGP